MFYYSILIVFILILLFLVIYLLRKNKIRTINYKTLFFVGIVWFVIGLPLRNEPLIMMGIAFAIIGFLNKNKWNIIK